VAEEGHITRAAERLSMQQPPLSQQIKALETELGVRLFHRRPRGVVLTDTGAAFFSDVTALLSGLNRAVARARRVSRGEEGRIAIGFTNSAIFHSAVRTAIRDFRAAFPAVDMALEEGASTELLDAVTENRIDVAFVRTGGEKRENVRVAHILSEPMLMAVPETHALAIAPEQPAALADLAGEPLILYRRSSGPGLYDRIIAACLRAGFTPTIAQEAPRVVSTLNLVAAGLGISIVPQSLCGSHLEGVAYRSIGQEPQLIAPIHLASRKSDPSAPMAAFVRSAMAIAKRPGSGERQAS
jgi:DNA-binding transcriptional LysR family regulator